MLIPEKILYEKKYPCNDPNNTEYFLPFSPAPAVMLDKEKTISPATEDIFKAVTKDITYHPIVMRIHGADEFIKASIKLSEELKVDTKISQGEHFIKVIFDVVCGICMADFKPMFAMADDFTLFPHKDNDLLISISFMYYTHATMKRGRIIRPLL